MPTDAVDAAHPSCSTCTDHQPRQDPEAIHGAARQQHHDDTGRQARLDAERHARQLVAPQPVDPVHVLVPIRTQDGERAAQSAAISRLSGVMPAPGEPVQGLSIRNWWLFELKNQARSGGAAPVAALAPVQAAGQAVAAPADPCNPPPPSVPNPDYERAMQEREALLDQARRKAAEIRPVQQRYYDALGGGDSQAIMQIGDEQVRLEGELAELERQIETLEATLYSQDAYSNPCNQDDIREKNNAIRAALNLPKAPELSADAAAGQQQRAQFSKDARAARSAGRREPGQAYYEDMLDGQRDWSSLPERERRQWADTEDRLLRDDDMRFLGNWRERVEAEADRARKVEQEKRLAAANAAYEAQRAEAAAADAAAARRRQAAAAQAAREQRLEALDQQARELNQQLREAAASGDVEAQRAIEKQLDEISQIMLTEGVPNAHESAQLRSDEERRQAQLAAQRTAAQQAAARDERQAMIDRRRDIEQQNANALTRLANYGGGVGVGAAKGCVELAQTGLDVVSTCLRATDIADAGPNRSALGRLWEESRGVGEFLSGVATGIGTMFVNWKDRLMEGDARGFGEETFNVVTVVEGARGAFSKARGVTTRTHGAPATAPPASVAPAAFNMSEFRSLSAAQQIERLVGQPEAVRTAALQQLSAAQRAAFVAADSERAVRVAPPGLYQSPDGVWTLLTDLGERRITGRDLAGLSRIEDLPAPGAYSAGMSAAEVQALFAKSGPLTMSELLAKADLIRQGRGPGRLAISPEARRVIFADMVKHYTRIKGTPPMGADLAVLMQILPGDAAPAAAGAVAAGAPVPTPLPGWSAIPEPRSAADFVPRGSLPKWLAVQGFNNGDLPAALRQPPRPMYPTDPGLSDVGTVVAD